jgi:hypothetical protein
LIYSCEHGSEPWSFIKAEEFIVQLSHFQLLKNSTAWNKLQERFWIYGRSFEYQNKPSTYLFNAHFKSKVSA